MLPRLELEQLRCPVTAGKLEWLGDERLAQLRAAVADELIVNRSGDLVTQPPAAALTSTDGSLAYPVRDGIPTLVPGEAIELGQLPQP